MKIKKNKIRLNQFILLLVIICLEVGLLYPITGNAQEYPRRTAIVEAVEKVSPAVVNISSEYEIRNRNNPFALRGDQFESYFRDFFDRGFERRQKRTSLGSGVIIDGERGYILTNTHVIERSANIKVVLKDEREFDAQIVGADPDSDITVLRIISDTPLPAVAVCKTDELMIGETVIAIGNPFGFSNTVTTGVISALNRSIRTEGRIYHDFIQTDASINPGNSGGPLLNINGQLIGINTAIYAKAQGIGFAIPIKKAQKIVADLIQYGEVVQVWVGIAVQDINIRLAQYLELSNTNGVIIKRVYRESPAQKAGLIEGDIIQTIGKQEVLSRQDYQALLKSYSSGDKMAFNLLRNGKPQTIKVRAETFPQEKAMELAYQLMGIKVADITKQNRRSHNILAPEGVMIDALNSETYLSNIGVRTGDVIRQLDDYKIVDVNDFEKAIIKFRNRNSLVVLLQRADQLFRIAVKL
jgi:Do/DeqQ family serine protease